MAWIPDTAYGNVGEYAVDELINYLSASIQQIKKYFNIDLKDIKLKYADDFYFAFQTKDFLIIKIFEETVIDKNFIIELMKNFKLDFSKFKDFVFVDGYLKLVKK